jgi:hypothetical protein
MNNSITWIIDGWRYWDATNGNSYHLTRVTHTKTGKSAIFSECEGNVRSLLNECERTRSGAYVFARCHSAPIQDIKYRTWKMYLKSEYYAPVNVYKREEQIKVINSLRSTK